MKKCLTGLFVFAALNLVFGQNVVSVIPGDGMLSLAIADAVDGDILQLVPGALYTESTGTNFGEIINKSITIETEGDGTEKAKVQLITPNDGTTYVFLNLGDQASLTLRGIEFDGSLDGAPSLTNLLKFTMGEFAAPTFVKKIYIENCTIHDFIEHVISAGNGEVKGYLIVDSTLVDNVIVEKTGTAVYYKYAGANYISVKNSTFNTISSYGMRIEGPGESAMPDNTPVVDIDHTTWYNVGTTDGREILLCGKGPNLNQWTVTNSIFAKQVLKTKTVINIKDQPTPDLAVISHICLWDVGKRTWYDHPVSDTINADPAFADPDNGDFTLPVGSPLLTFGSDGKSIGDPRWAVNEPVAVEPVEKAAKDFALHQNYPNPFNPSTTISFRIKQSGLTTMTVYDLLGREIAQPVNAVLEAGIHRVTFDASALHSGVYFYKLQSAGQTLIRKMTFLE